LCEVFFNATAFTAVGKTYLRSIFSSRVILSQDWLPTVQLVLQADWQVLLHSPQAVTFFSAGFAIVLIIAFLSYLCI
jgi:hypothetical protein